MKMLTAALVLAIASSLPTSGQAKTKKSPSVPATKSVSGQVVSPGALVQSNRRPRSPNPQWDVYRTDGAYAGSDPDPRIRAMMFRDDPNADP